MWRGSLLAGARPRERGGRGATARFSKGGMESCLFCKWLLTDGVSRNRLCDGKSFLVRVGPSGWRVEVARSWRRERRFWLIVVVGLGTDTTSRDSTRATPITANWRTSGQRRRASRDRIDDWPRGGDGRRVDGIGGAVPRCGLLSWAIGVNICLCAIAGGGGTKEVAREQRR